MRCISPFVKRNSKGVFEEFPCGKCPACRTRRVQHWAYRLLDECKYHDRLFFPTFTYTDDRVPLVEHNGEHYMTLDRKQMQDYIKRLRKLSGATIKYYLVGEYGGTTYRPHYHGIFFASKALDYAHFIEEWRNVDDGDLLGHVYFGDVRSASIKYVVGYLNKEIIWNDSDPRQRPFANISKGLGLNALDASLARRIETAVETASEYFYFEGYKISIPRYYRDKVFPDGIERDLPPARPIPTDNEVRDAVAWTKSYLNKHGKRKN